MLTGDDSDCGLAMLLIRFDGYGVQRMLDVAPRFLDEEKLKGSQQTLTA